MSALILIVEDEQDLLTALEYSLEQAGFTTRSATTGATALDALGTDPLPDLVVLDLMLPDMSGTEVCRRIRSKERTKEIPILMATAKGEEIDRVVGFEVGADDYVVKPFSTRELTLRIRAILRRSQKPNEQNEEVAFGRLRIDLPGHRTWVDEQEVKLTALEFKLLKTFHARRGRVQTRDLLLSDVWDIQAEVTTRTVDTHVKRLREKLGSAGAYIETVRGVGYRFRQRPEETAI